MRFDIRAELANRQKVDFQVESPNLSDARAFAETILEAQADITPKFDWRGQIVFVNCGPAEESMIAVKAQRYSLTDLLHLQSIRESLRARAHLNYN